MEISLIVFTSTNSLLLIIQRCGTTKFRSLLIIYVNRRMYETKTWQRSGTFDLCVSMFDDWRINEVNYVLQITPNFREASAPSPSSSPSPGASNHVQNDHYSSQQVLSQIWQRSGSCPDGTIPIRRIRSRDLLRATGLEHFGKKPANSYHSTNDEKGSVIINGTRVELGPQVNRSVSKRYV